MTDPTTTDPTPKKRTDWDAKLAEACAAWEAANPNRRIVAQSMIYPAAPGAYVRVDDELPRSFGTPKDAAIAVGFWTNAPGAAKNGGAA